MTVQKDDQFIVHRNGKDYRVDTLNLEATLEDDDFMLISSDGVDYKVSGAEVKDYLYTTPLP